MVVVVSNVEVCTIQNLLCLCHIRALRRRLHSVGGCAQVNLLAAAAQRGRRRALCHIWFDGVFCNQALLT